MEMKPVKSSMLSHVGYDERTRTLHVQYHRGGRYAHPGVPVEKYTQMMASPSIGAYLNKHIKPQHPAR